MSYKKSMGGDNPGLFVFVLDQSGSMGEAWPQSPKHRKADALADVLNNTLAEIGARCVKGEGRVSNRCEIALLGYEGSKVGSVWGGQLQGQEIVSISEISTNPLDIEKRKVMHENGKGGIIEVEEDVPVWIKANTGGGTPMKKALAHALKLVQNWLPNHPDAFPPIVIHVTDGEPTGSTPDERDPSPEATAIRNLATSDGHALLVNINIHSNSPVKALFPKDAADLPGNDAGAQLLFEMSSIIPDELVEVGRNEGLNMLPGSRLMVLNADAVDVIRLIQFATIGIAMDR